MIETSTKNLSATINEDKVKEADVIEILEADDLLFYNSLRVDLDILQRKPAIDVIDKILHYSKDRH
jgi:hypothetical protein